MSETLEIPLTKGKVAIVSEEDYDFLNRWKWHVTRRDRVWYAGRRSTVKLSDGSKKRISIRMHRIVLSRMLGHEDFEMVDHIDGDGLNNQRDNLRSVTRKQNLENRHGVNKNNKSGIRGVSWSKRKKKWRVDISDNGKQIYLGSFRDIAEAEQASIAGRNEYFTHHTD